LKLGCDGGDAEDQDEEVECIQRPAQEAGVEGVALQRSEATKVADEFHGEFPSAIPCARQGPADASIGFQTAVQKISNYYGRT
jgi:hypothetical protein